MNKLDKLVRALSKKTPDHTNVVGPPKAREEVLDELPSIFNGGRKFAFVIHMALQPAMVDDFIGELSRRLKYMAVQKDPELSAAISATEDDWLEGDWYDLSLAVKEIRDLGRKVLVVVDNADLWFDDDQHRRTLGNIRYLSEQGSFTFVLGSGYTMPWGELNTFNPIPLRV